MNQHDIRRQICDVAERGEDVFAPVGRPVGWAYEAMRMLREGVLVQEGERFRVAEPSR